MRAFHDLYLFYTGNMVCLNGIEPSHMASEATALSSELQAQIYTYNIITNSLEICKRL